MAKRMHEDDILSDDPAARLLDRENDLVASQMLKEKIYRSDDSFVDNDSDDELADVWRSEDNYRPKLHYGRRKSRRPFNYLGKERCLLLYIFRT